MSIRQAAFEFTQARNLSQAESAFEAILQLLSEEHADGDLESAAENAIKTYGVDYSSRMDLLHNGIWVDEKHPEARQFVRWLQKQGCKAELGTGDNNAGEQKFVQNLWEQYEAKVPYILADDCPEKIIFQTLPDSGCHDMSDYGSLGEAWEAEKGEWWVRNHEGGNDAARQEFMSTLTEATPDEALEAAMDGKTWPIDLGYVLHRPLDAQ